MAAAQLIVLALAVFSLAAEAKFFGGASSFKAFAADIISGYNSKFRASVPAYDPSGSAAGIAGFFAGTYSIGASDAPLNAAQDNTANNLGPAGHKGKLTIPLCLSTFTFATKKAGNVKLTGAQVIAIYKGTLKSWSAISSGSSGTITPVARSDGSGSTNIINTWLNAYGWKLTGDASWNGQSGISSSVHYEKGSGGVVTYLAGNKNAIGYVITGLAISGGLFQSYIKNPANNYVLATQADPAQSIPRSLPGATQSWSGVSLVNAGGAATFPLVSFEYTFMKIAGGYLVKNFMTYTQTTAVQNLLNTKYNKEFFRLPAKVATQNQAAIKTIFV